jgi:hypothetical protein
VEAYAIGDGVRLAAVRGYTNVIIESDAKEVVAICHQDDERSDIIPICQEILSEFLLVLAFSILGWTVTMLPIYMLSKLVLIGEDVCGLFKTQAFSVAFS